MSEILSNSKYRAKIKKPVFTRVLEGNGKEDVKKNPHNGVKMWNYLSVLIEKFQIKTD